MNADWMSDARKIPDEVMNYIRRIAVRAVVEDKESPELIAKIFRISRASIYQWLRWYHEEGESGLDTRKAPGAHSIITPQIEHWLKKTILCFTPEDYGYDTTLWTLKILASLLEKEFGIQVEQSTVANHLHKIKGSI